MKTSKGLPHTSTSAGSGWLAFILMISAMFLLSEAVAQSKWGMQVRPGVNFATGKLGGVSLTTGYGAEATFSYRFMPHLSAYAGWSWNQFSSQSDIAGSKLDFEETGYNFGLQFVHPFSKQSRLGYMIKGGGTYNHIETENRHGVTLNDTKHGFGWQLGAGMTIPAGRRFQVIPELRYRSLTRKVNNTNLQLQYVSVGVGVGYQF